MIRSRLCRMPRMTLRADLCVVGLSVQVVLTGCGDSNGSPHPGPITWDSAGIQIVEAGPIDDRIAFRLSEEPEYVVGWGPGDIQFHFVSAGALLSDGRAVIADGGANQTVSVVSRSGEMERVWGGPGAGPGEFERLRAVHAYGADTIVAQEVIGPVVRITFLHESTGSRTEMVDLPVVDMRVAIGIDHQHGLILARSGTPIVDPMDPWHQASLLRLDLQLGRVDRVLDYDLVAGSSGYPLGRFGAVGLVGDRLIVARSDRPLIEIADLSGAIDRIVRWEEAQPVADDAFWQRYAERLLETGDREREDVDQSIEYRKALGSLLPYFPFRPPTGGIVEGEGGSIWIAEDNLYSGIRHDVRYRVFSSDGRWLGWVEMPERSSVVAVRDGLVLLVRYDQFRVPAAALYRLEGVQ